MRLLGKYAFETLRNTFQGVFEFYMTADESGEFYILELWQLRITICPNKYIEVLFNQGQNKAYKSLGKIKLENYDI